MKSEVKVSKELAETLRQKKSAKRNREFLRRLIILEKASQPIEKDGKLVITEQASKARILLEIFGASFGSYTQVWKDVVDLLKDTPSAIETVYNQLSKKEYQDVDDAEGIAALEEFVQTAAGLLKKAKALKQELDKKDEEFKKFADSISPGADVATPTSIDVSDTAVPEEVAPASEGEGEDEAGISLEDL